MVIEILSDLQDIASQYDVDIIFWDYHGRNSGSAEGTKSIYMQPCDEDWMYEVIFWHELGHVLMNKIMQETKRPHYVCILTREGVAWELGLAEAAKHGRVWEYSSPQLTLARELFASYVNCHLDDLRDYYSQ